MKQVDPQDARQGRPRNIVRWVLSISFALAFICLAFIYFVFAA